ncbi:hypothetical protein M8C21_007891 [Ambrosia artemisiifolia]|uniref:Uncharacterized protein n=1 Tax=Ambrosia artemisiifolia TaxID=4212 RepID=A0AAD5DCR9_AMBAR|nr:hypothetical protein M8C21_007891 [Ambrosia artemisiifolia]
MMQLTPSSLIKSPLKLALEVFDHFVIDLSSYWSRILSPSKSTLTSPPPSVQQQDGKDSITPCTLVVDNTTTTTTTPLNPSSVDNHIPHEHIVESGNEVSCERSPVTAEFKIDPSLEMSCIVSNTVDSSTRSKCLGVSGRRMTRSLTKLDNNSTNSFHPVNETSNMEDIHITSKCSDVNDNIVLVKTNMKGCRNKNRNGVEIPLKEGVPATHGAGSNEADMNQSMSRAKQTTKSDKSTSPRVMNRNMSKTKLPVKRKLITSPKSDKSTSIMVKKGSEERYGSANILSIECFSGKKSRSGRVLLPPLEFWRNQKVVYDEDGELWGVQEPE